MKTTSRVPTPAHQPIRAYRLLDMSFGDPHGEDPLEAYSWQDLREVVYGDPRELPTRDPFSGLGSARP